MKKITILTLIIMAMTLISAGFLLYIQPGKPGDEALDSLLSDEAVLVEQNRLTVFRPGGRITEKALVFWEETTYAPAAYAPLCRDLAEEGITVFLMRYPLNIPLFDRHNPDELNESYPGIRQWFFAGHGTGGSRAAELLTETELPVSGLILLGSAPDTELLLRDDLAVLSLYGSLDGIITPEKIEERKCRLPLSTRFVEIPGGNHSQFASYDTLFMDEAATIHRNVQRKETVFEIVNFIRNL